MTSPKQPGKIWHIWQNTKLGFKALFNADERPKLKNSAVRAGVAVGGAALAYFTWPIWVVGWIGAAAGALICVSGIKSSYDHLASIKEGRFGQTYLRERLNAWKSRQAKGGYSGIVKSAVSTAINTTGKAIGLTAVVAGLGAAVIGGLNMFGVNLGAAAPLAEAMANGMTAFGIGTAAALPVATGLGVAAAAVGGMTASRCNRALKASRGNAANTKAAAPLPSWLVNAQKMSGGSAPAQKKFNAASNNNKAATTRASAPGKDRRNGV